MPYAPELGLVAVTTPPDSRSKIEMAHEAEDGSVWASTMLSQLPDTLGVTGVWLGAGAV
jgi:hypothetical protein